MELFRIDLIGQRRTSAISKHSGHSAWLWVRYGLYNSLSLVNEDFDYLLVCFDSCSPESVKIKVCINIYKGFLR